MFFVLSQKQIFVESIIQKQDVYLDDEFKTSSPSANFLSRIVHSDSSRFVQVNNKIGLNNIMNTCAPNIKREKMFTILLSRMFRAVLNKIYSRIIKKATWN
ncbi:conserved Plasmodium protein, unknown function [Plasmodium malariae]|uniref:Uncharacterized protein n=1 Tax=Plasmodium malariae TaxID=5858 RepID=A0A1A8X3F1_PLAMA|nr:conserved Plasmodium protein, unknown function [Plasmodium malariae]